MCKVYNQIGCLTEIKSHLHKHDIQYKSLDDLTSFRDNYLRTREQIISTHRLIIEQEQHILSDQLIQVDHSIKIKKEEVEQQLLVDIENLKNRVNWLSSIHSNTIQTLINLVKKIIFKIRIEIKKFLLNSKVSYSLRDLTNNYNKASDRHRYIDNYFENAVMASCSLLIKELDRKKNVIDQINNSTYGAIGEEKVVEELENLSDDHILINDFKCEFERPIYNRQENDYIKSIQIDHILLSPAGVFLIETKNWSQHSINNPSLFSPVQQIRRANFALYKILNRHFSNASLIFSKHHWGSRKIPVKNLIVFTNYKPDEEFEFVKILAPRDLLGHIKYFKHSFSSNEIQSMADYLLKI